MKKFPEILELQFHNVCNSNCSICPYEEYASGVNLLRMEEKLKAKILAEIENNRKYLKRVIPYFNNEPFLDPNFLSLLKWFREKVPELKIEVSTNLSIFKKGDFEDILQNSLIHDFRISFFGGSKESYLKVMPGLKYEKTLENLKDFLAMRKKLQPDFDYQIIMVLDPELIIQDEIAHLQSYFPDEKLNFKFFGYLDRAGSNAKKNSKIINHDKAGIVSFAGCSLKRNEERLCVDVNGNVPLCSQDWFLSENLGSLSAMSISEIWNSERKKKVDDVISGKTSCASGFICKDCKLINLRTEQGVALNFRGDKYMNENDTKRIE